MTIHFTQRSQWGEAVRLAKVRYETANAIYQTLRQKYPLATRTPEQQDIVNGADSEMRNAHWALDKAKLDDPNWSKLIWTS